MLDILRYTIRIKGRNNMIKRAILAPVLLLLGTERLGVEGGNNTVVVALAE